MVKGAFKRTLIVGGLILAVLAVLGGLKYLSNRSAGDKLVLSGTIEADEIQVGSKVAGRIASVLVQEGQQVARDQVLVKFDAFDLDARRKDAVAAVAAAEASYEKSLNWFRPEEVAQARARAEAAWMSYEEARNGPRRQEIDAARAEVNAANADYEVAKVTLARVEQLARNGVQSQQDLDNAKAAFDRAEARRAAAAEQLKLLLAGTRPEEVSRAERVYKEAAANLQLVERGARKEDIAAAKAQLERARAGLSQIETQLGELEVRSPADASVEVLRLRPGDLVQPNSPVATLVEINRLWVRVYVPETEKGFVQLGDEVSITVDSFPRRSFSGLVEHIASKGEFTPRNVQTREERTHQVFAVRVRVDNTERLLSAGMAADVTINKNQATP
jgi:multidrug resistance efflux pump